MCEKDTEIDFYYIKILKGCLVCGAFVLSEVYNQGPHTKKLLAKKKASK